MSTWTDSFLSPSERANLGQTEKCRKRFGEVKVNHTQIFTPINLTAQGMGPREWVLWNTDKRSLTVVARAEFREVVGFLEC